MFRWNIVHQKLGQNILQATYDEGVSLFKLLSETRFNMGRSVQVRKLFDLIVVFCISP